MEIIPRAEWSSVRLGVWSQLSICKYSPEKSVFAKRKTRPKRYYYAAIANTINISGSIGKFVYIILLHLSTFLYISFLVVSLIVNL